MSEDTGICRVCRDDARLADILVQRVARGAKGVGGLCSAGNSVTHLAQRLFSSSITSMESVEPCPQ